MNIFKHTLIYKTYSFIKSYFVYRKERNYIKDTLYSREFKFVLRKYLNLNVKKDWLGRLYGIINPLIDINGNLDVNSVVIELDGNNSNNVEYVQVWIHKQLKLISDLFKIHKLYDYINLTLEHVGPQQLDNYLVIFDIVSRKDMANKFKSFFKHLFSYGIIFIIYMIMNYYFL